MLLHLPLRQTEGFVGSIFRLMDLNLEVPDHTTLSRRPKNLRIPLRAEQESGPIHLIVDSTGLAILGQGQWAAAKHGKRGRQGWKKLHFCVDEKGNIVSQALTDASGDDANTAVGLMTKLECDIASITGDRAYDTRHVYGVARKHSARVVVPPIKNARQRGRRDSERNKTIRRIREIGVVKWKRESGYHSQCKVENAVFRYKAIFGDRMRARHPDSQQVEARIATNALIKLSALGMPKSYAVRT
jgi:hypothetical protein